MFEHFDADAGPVLVTVRYVVDPAKAQEFLRAIYRYQRIRRRDGATQWGIFQDTEAANIYLETFLVDSWAEHERQHHRFTMADREAERRVQECVVEPTKVKHYIYAKPG